jgi:hypothetical protein
MKIKPSWVLIIGLLAAHTEVLYAQEEIPNDFSSTPVDAPGSFDFVKACMPSASESSFNRSIRQAGANATVTTFPTEKTQPFMAVTKGKVFCVKRSSHGNPVMPLVVFDDTINFEMAQDEIRRLRTDLSRQLATVGFASALVVNGSGNAYQIAYIFNSDKPTRLYYHAGFLKKSEFSESQFSSIYRAKDTMSFTSRGQSEESYKPFF